MAVLDLRPSGDSVGKGIRGCQASLASTIHRDVHPVGDWWIEMIPAGLLQLSRLCGSCSCQSAKRFALACPGCMDMQAVERGLRGLAWPILAANNDTTHFLSSVVSFPFLGRPGPPGVLRCKTEMLPTQEGLLRTASGMFVAL